VIAVDIFKEFENYRIQNFRKEYEENITKYQLDHLVEIYEGEANEMSKIFPDDHFDLVFIDAGHQPGDALSNIMHWKPKIKPNGIISGHDYHMKTVMEDVNTILFNLKVKWAVWSEKI